MKWLVALGVASGAAVVYAGWLVRDDVMGMCSLPIERLDQLLAAERDNEMLRNLVAAYEQAVQDYRTSIREIFGDLAVFKDTA
jgi:precorrin-4 methylase